MLRCCFQRLTFLPRCMQCRCGLAMRILSIPYERSFSLVFWEEEWVGGGATPSTWNSGSTGPRWSEIADFQPIFACGASAVTPSEKSSVNTNRKSTTRFPKSLRWSSYMAPPKPQKGAQKRQTADFRRKSHFALRNSPTKFLRVKIVSGKVVRHSLA